MLGMRLGKGCAGPASTAGAGKESANCDGFERAGEDADKGEDDDAADDDDDSALAA